MFCALKVFVGKSNINPQKIYIQQNLISHIFPPYGTCANISYKRKIYIGSTIYWNLIKHIPAKITLSSLVDDVTMRLFLQRPRIIIHKYNKYLKIKIKFLLHILSFTSAHLVLYFITQCIVWKQP